MNFRASWPGLTRPSVPADRPRHRLPRPDRLYVDGRVKPGHDEAWVDRVPALFVAFLAILCLSLAIRAFAVEPGERLADPKLEARAEQIGQTLRCLVCQNESIEESNAGLAHDIRVLLRQLLLKGDTDEQARQAIVARYGEFVLLNPPLQPATYVLWYGPVALLLIGFAGIVLWLRFRRHDTAATSAPLSPQEQSRLDTLLREADR